MSFTLSTSSSLWSESVGVKKSLLNNTFKALFCLT